MPFLLWSISMTVCNATASAGWRGSPPPSFCNECNPCPDAYIDSPKDQCSFTICDRPQLPFRAPREIELGSGSDQLWDIQYVTREIALPAPKFLLLSAPRSFRHCEENTKHSMPPLKGTSSPKASTASPPPSKTVRLSRSEGKDGPPESHR